MRSVIITKKLDLFISNTARRFGIALCVLLFASPFASVYAQIQATPVPETPTPAVGTPTPEVDPTPTDPLTDPHAEIPATPGAEVIAPTQVPAPVGTPTPPGNMIAPMAVNPGGSLVGCTQNPANGNITSSQVSTITCTIRVANYSNSTANQRGLIERPALPTGFAASITVSGVRNGPVSMPNGSGASVLAFDFNNGSNGFRTATAVITLSVTSSVAQGTSFSATFRACHAASSGSACHATNPQNGSAIVTAQVPNASIVPLVEGTDYTFACGSPVTAGYLGTVESTCTMSISNSAILLDGLRISQVVSSVTGPAGWTISLRHNTSGALLANVPGTYSVPSSVTLHPLTNPTWSFKVRFVNTGCPTNAITSVNVSLAVQRILLVLPGPIQYLAGKNIQASVNLPTQVSLSSISATGVTSSYSMTSSKQASTNLVMNYRISGCGPWNGSARIGKFIDPANPGRTTVPTLTGATQVSTSQNPTGLLTVAVPVIPTIGETNTRVISGTGPGPTPVTVTQTIQLNYNIPANTPVGTYQATITVNTASGP